MFNEYGLWGKYARYSNHRKRDLLAKDYGRSFQRLLIKLLESPDIEKRLSSIIKTLHGKSDFREVVVLSCVLSILNYEASQNLLRELLDIDDAIWAKLKKDTSIRQLLSLDGGKFAVKSSILARFLLTRIEDSKLVVDVLVQAAKRADSLGKYDYLYRNIFREIMRYGNLHGMLPEKQRRPSIITFYESIKNFHQSSNNPHFWLQYAIARLSFPDLKEAKIYLDTAYSLAGERYNYNTSQIDNHYARYLLEEAKTGVDTKHAFDLFREAHALLAKQILREKVHHPYRVASNYYDVYLRHYNDFESNDKKTFIDCCEVIIKRIDKLSTETMQHRHVKECKMKLDEILRQEKNQK